MINGWYLLAQHQGIDDGLLLPSLAEGECKEMVGRKHCNKTQFFCFSFLWLHRHMRPATLLSSLAVINECAVHSGREEWSNCYLYCLPRNARVINYGELGFAESKIKEQKSKGGVLKVFNFCKTGSDKGCLGTWAPEDHADRNSLLWPCSALLMWL